MGLSDFFRKRRFGDWASLEAFVDRNAAFLVNRAMYEYARARSGMLSEKLMREEAFKTAMEAARWRGFPYALGHILEMVEGEMRAPARGREVVLLHALIALAGRVLCKYPPPPDAPADFWEEARAKLEARLILAAGAPRKAAHDIPNATFSAFFSLVPMHESVRAIDYPIVRNNVRMIMVNALDRFRREADIAALVVALPGDRNTPS